MIRVGGIDCGINPTGVGQSKNPFLKISIKQEKVNLIFETVQNLTEQVLQIVFWILP